MKTPNTKLREGIYTKLNGTITLDSAFVPVFDLMALPEQEMPYVVVSSSTVVPDDINKDKIEYTATVQIDISTDASQGGVGTASSDDIANQVTQLLDTINYDLGVDFDLIEVGIDGIQTVPIDVFTTQNVARNIVNLRYRILEK